MKMAMQSMEQQGILVNLLCLFLMIVQVLLHQVFHQLLQSMKQEQFGGLLGRHILRECLEAVF